MEMLYIDKTELSEVEWEIKIGLFLQVVACILQKRMIEPFSEEDMDAILAEAKLEKGEQ